MLAGFCWTDWYQLIFTSCQSTRLYTSLLYWKKKNIFFIVVQSEKNSSSSILSVLDQKKKKGGGKDIKIKKCWASFYENLYAGYRPQPEGWPFQQKPADIRPICRAPYLTEAALTTGFCQTSWKTNTWSANACEGWSVSSGRMAAPVRTQ